jgi:hypothetical protein
MNACKAGCEITQVNKHEPAIIVTSIACLSPARIPIHRKSIKLSKQPPVYYCLLPEVGGVSYTPRHPDTVLQVDALWKLQPEVTQVQHPIKRKPTLQAPYLGLLGLFAARVELCKPPLTA